MWQGQGRTSTHSSTAVEGSMGGQSQGRAVVLGSDLSPSAEAEPWSDGMAAAVLLECFSRTNSCNPHNSLVRQMPLSSHCTDEKIKAQNGNVFTQGHRASKCLGQNPP